MQTRSRTEAPDKYTLQDASKITIHAKNLSLTRESSFSIKILEGDDMNALQSFVSQVTLTVFILVATLLMCASISCIAAKAVHRARTQRQVSELNDRVAAFQEDGSRRRSSDVTHVEINRERARRVRQEMEQKAYEEKLKSYEKLIPEIKWRKGNPLVDDFGSTECVICMDPLLDGSKVRKIPTCKHVFHGKCLMTWLKSLQQKDVQKCP